MHRIVLIMPEWMSHPDGESLLRQKLPTLEAIVERSHMFRLRPILNQEPTIGHRRSVQPSNSPLQTPEAAYLGLDPASVRLAQGPLTVAALGMDPPERSVHFHLSLMSCEDGWCRQVRHEVSPDQLRIVMDTARRLDSKRLTLVQGEGSDHGLVWEAGSIDLRTHSPTGPMEGLHVPDHLPEGDGETILRRYIDDSINLLSELPLNEERAEEGLEPLNLLWPWGQGFREPVPNLLLQRGERAWVESGSMRLEGLARLAGYRHGDRKAVGKGTSIRLEELVDSAWKNDPSIIVIEAIADFRREGKLEEAAWLTAEIDRRWLEPIWQKAKNDYVRLLVLAPSLAADGLALSCEPGYGESPVAPFDERALERPGLERAESWRLIERTLMLP